MQLCLLSPDTPSQWVQFILRTKQYEQHIPHDVFSELDEICVKEAEDPEWKEMARSFHFCSSCDGREVPMLAVPLGSAFCSLENKASAAAGANVGSLLLLPPQSFNKGVGVLELKRW